MVTIFGSQMISNAHWRLLSINKAVSNNYPIRGDHFSTIQRKNMRFFQKFWGYHSLMHFHWDLPENKTIQCSLAVPSWLVRGLNPSGKIWQSVGISIPNILKNKKSSKPPTRWLWKPSFSMCSNRRLRNGRRPQRAPAEPVLVPLQLAWPAVSVRSALVQPMEITSMCAQRDVSFFFGGITYSKTIVDLVFLFFFWVVKACI